MFKYIQSFTVQPYSAAITYEKFDIVKNSAGRFFVSIADANVENADAILVNNDGTNWKNFETLSDIFQIWKPTLGLGISIQDAATNFSFGGISVPSNRENSFSYDKSVIWDSITYKEYKSLVAFLEFRGQDGFYVSSSFGKVFKVLVASFTKSRDNYNRYSVTASLTRTKFADPSAPIA